MSDFRVKMTRPPSPNVPDDMKENGRPIDDAFPRDESLYLRFQEDQWVREHAVLSINAIRFPDQSVNRDKYGKPEYVLLPFWLDQGVASFKVRDIPDELDVGSSRPERKIEFSVRHKPLKMNYTHSEIHAYEAGAKLGTPPPKSVRKQFREEIRKYAAILLDPKLL